MPKKKRKPTTSFGGLGLAKIEDAKLIKKLKKADLSLAKLLRKLVREWIDN